VTGVPAAVEVGETESDIVEELSAAFARLA